MRKLEPLLTKKEVAKLLGMSTKSVDKLIKNGKLPVVKFGRAHRFLPLDVKKLINKTRN